MPRPPPLSTLFPYTTLFRSHHGAGRPHLQPEPAAARSRDAAGEVPADRVLPDPALAGGRADVRAVRLRGDRKSTRLNSSHRCISYAVFCLKKKKKHKQILND